MKRKVYLLGILLVLASSITSITWMLWAGTATSCSVWTEDAGGAHKIQFSLLEPVHINWLADPAGATVDITVEAPDGSTVLALTDQSTSGEEIINPAITGIYAIMITGSPWFYIAIGTFNVIPEVPILGTLLTFGTMLGALFLRKRK